jgi:hypothetical protein
MTNSAGRFPSWENRPQALLALWGYCVNYEKGYFRFAEISVAAMKSGRKIN